MPNYVVSFYVQQLVQLTKHADSLWLCALVVVVASELNKLHKLKSTSGDGNLIELVFQHSPGGTE